MLVLMVTLVDREMAGIIIKLFGYFLCLVPVLLDIKKSFSSTVALISGDSRNFIQGVPISL